MRLLYVVHRVPFPPNKGDKIRTYNILRHLASRHEVHVATLVDDSEDLAFLSDLGQVAESVISARIDGRIRKMLSLRAILQSRSVTVRHFYDRGLQKELDAIMDARYFDAVLCSSSPTAEYLFRSRHWNGSLKACLKVMDLIDVDSLKWKQYAERSMGPSRWIYSYEATHLERYESRIYREFDRILLVSELERSCFPGVDPDKKISALSNGVDLEYFSPAEPGEAVAGPPAIVFTGMMDYWPNIEGMRWFMTSVLPLIQRGVPEFQLLVVGGRPTAEVLKWGAMDNVTVTGFVDDIREYIARADVCIAPLQIARGIQNKVLEAMAMGKAVVSTPYALEGIGATPGKHALVASESQEFADRVIALLNDRQRAQSLGDSARLLVEQHFSWSKNLASLDSLLEQAASVSRRACRPHIAVSYGRYSVIGVHVRDVLEVARADEPVRVSVPFPKGLLSAASRMVVLDPAGNCVRDQQRPLAKWPDGSTKWLLLDFVSNRESHSAETYRLRPASGSDTDDSGSALVCTDNDEFTVDTGALQVLIPACGADLFVNTNWPGQELRDFKGQISLTDSHGKPYAYETQSLSVDENGPLRATVSVTGRFVSGGKALPLVVTTKLTFFAQRSGFVAEVDVWNPRAAMHPGNVWDLGDSGSVIFRDISIDLVRNETPREVSWQTELTTDRRSADTLPWSIYQDSSGGENWNSPNHVDANGEATVSFRGYEVRSGDDPSAIGSGSRSEPLVCLKAASGWIAATVEDFWQNFPKAIRCRSNGFGIGLFPGECSRPFELQGGERKRHTVMLELGNPETPCSLHRMIRPLEAIVDPGWVQQSGAVPYLSARSDDGDAVYDKYMTSIIDGPRAFVNRREEIDEYGWRNFGELYADHESVGQPQSRPRVSHYNNQYDFVFAAAVHYLRSGDVRWRRLMKDAARHHIDIDIYHTDRDRPAYSGGMFWHTDHYMEAATATHRTYSGRNASGRDYGGGPSNEHNYTSGLLHYYYLTGDTAARSAVLSLANWVLAMDDGHVTVLALFSTNDTGKASATVDQDYHKAGRGAGNSINALIDAYALSGDRKYMAKAEALILRCIHPDDDIESLDLDEPELRWSYLVFLQTLGKYLATKHELGETDYYFYYARDSLLHYAFWMRDNEVPYKDVLDKVELPTESWPAQDIRKCHVFHLAASCTRGEQRQAFSERAEYFYRRCLDDLLSFETAYLTRPRVILAAYGYAHSYFCDLRPENSQNAYYAEHCYDFGEPSIFEPQRAFLKKAIRQKCGWVTGEIGRVIKEKAVAFSGLLSRRQDGSQ